MSESVSAVVTATAPLFLGVWMHDPRDPSGTEHLFLYAADREVQVESVSSSFRLVGRRYPIREYAEFDDRALKVAIRVPFGEDHADGVGWLRDFAELDAVIVYRDNRGRILFATVDGGVVETDTREGTVFTFTLAETDYDEAV